MSKVPEILSAYSLKIGPWHKLFREDQYKMLIAAAINATLHENKEIEVSGYLITRKKVCLIFHNSKEQIRAVTPFFLEWLKQEIKLWFQKHIEINREAEELDIDDMFYYLEQPLFSKQGFPDKPIYFLLLGNAMLPEYYIPSWDRFIKKLKNYTFSSYIDYKGGVSAVEVTSCFVYDTKTIIKNEIFMNH